MTTSARPVLISGVRAPVALHLARLFAACGHPVVLVDHLKHPVSAAGKFADNYYRIPPFTTEPQAAASALSEIIASEGVELVIPTCEEVLHLAALWDRTRMDAVLFAPGAARLGQVHNKFRFVQLCNDLGLATPRTHLLETRADCVAHEATAGNKVFKPVWSRFGAETLIRPDAAQLRQIAPTALAPWVAQDFVSGAEICTYAVARQGRIVALAAYRGVVRAGPGAAVCFAPVDTSAIRPFVETFVRETGWTGQISFDLMQTDKGQVLPLECNPRATSGLHFFTDPAAFSGALFKDHAEVRPDVNRLLAVRLALWLYGMPMMLRRGDRKRFFEALRQSEDVMDWAGDRVGWGAQLRSVAEFAGIALRQRISLERASTWGIEWSGKDQSSIS